MTAKQQRRNAKKTIANSGAKSGNREICSARHRRNAVLRFNRHFRRSQRTKTPAYLEV
jgi:hypothetical protein